MSKYYEAFNCVHCNQLIGDPLYRVFLKGTTDVCLDCFMEIQKELKMLRTPIFIQLLQCGFNRFDAKHLLDLPNSNTIIRSLLNLPDKDSKTRCVKNITRLMHTKKHKKSAKKKSY